MQKQYYMGKLYGPLYLCLLLLACKSTPPQIDCRLETIDFVTSWNNNEPVKSQLLEFKNIAYPTFSELFSLTPRTKTDQKSPFVKTYSPVQISPLFFQQLVLNNKINKGEYEQFIAQISEQYTFRIQSKAIPPFVKEKAIESSISTVIDYKQYSPLIQTNKKGIVYEVSHHQFGNLPIVAKGTILFLEKNTVEKWVVTFKYVDWIT